MRRKAADSQRKEREDVPANHDQSRLVYRQASYVDKNAVSRLQRKLETKIEKKETACQKYFPLFLKCALKCGQTC